MSMGDVSRFEWEHCTRCGNGLWRKFSDRLEMTISPRGGQRRTIRVPLDNVPGLRVVCEKCGTELLASPDGTWSTTS